MTDAPDPVDPPPSSPPAAGTPLGLDYFTTDEAARRASWAANFGVGVVVVSLAPFACGVINVAVAGQSYSAPVVDAHRGGAMLFLSAGIVVCAVGLVWLTTLRHWTGVLLAVAVLLLQMVVVTCIGIAYAD